MKRLILSFAGVEIGPFLEEEVQRYLKEGDLLLSDKVRSAEDHRWFDLGEYFKTASSPPANGNAGEDLHARPKKAPKFEFPPETEDEPDPLPPGWFNLDESATPKPVRV